MSTMRAVETKRVPWWQEVAFITALMLLGLAVMWITG